MVANFNPITDITDSALVLDRGEWPNFHDAEVHYLTIWRGDVRPEKNLWIGPVIEAVFELCALQYPYIAILRFHDCKNMRLEDFNHQNAVYDLRFEYQQRGVYRDGAPLPPCVAVNFKQAFDVALSFKCMRVQAVERREIEDLGQYAYKSR